MKKKDIWISIAVIVGAVLIFSLLTRGHGYITLNTPNAKLVLKSGWFNKTRIKSDNEPVKIKAGTHNPSFISLKTTKDKDTWQITSSGPWGDLTQIKVSKNETTNLNFGPPLLVKPNVRKRKNVVSVGLAITGKATAGSEIKNNRPGR
ncbi:MAG: hypothetical protein ACYSWP_23895 [Planctomycetota bacterium]|jgi:hypothetical protein